MFAHAGTHENCSATKQQKSSVNQHITKPICAATASKSKDEFRSGESLAVRELEPPQDAMEKELDSFLVQRFEFRGEVKFDFHMIEMVHSPAHYHEVSSQFKYVFDRKSCIGFGVTIVILM